MRKIGRGEKEFVTGSSCLRWRFAMQQQQKWLVLVYVTQLSRRSFWKWFRVHFVSLSVCGFVLQQQHCCCFFTFNWMPCSVIYHEFAMCIHTFQLMVSFVFLVVATAFVQYILTRFSRTNESSTLKIKESRNFLTHRRWFGENGKSFRRHIHEFVHNANGTKADRTA